MSIRDYPAVQAALAGQDVSQAAAQAHGALCGALCVSPGYALGDWLAEVVPDSEPALRSRHVLVALFEVTHSALAAGDMRFMPLLPDDEAALPERVAALGEWCAGFLYGAGASGIGALGDLPGEVGEVLRDYAEINRAAIDPGDSEEGNEASYAELVEFVRVAAQLLYDELAPVREALLARRGAGP